MQSDPAPISKKALWAGRIMSALPSSRASFTLDILRASRFRSESLRSPHRKIQ